MASRAGKRMATSGQEVPKTECREQRASQTHEDQTTEGARWGTQEDRQKQRWQKGGKAPASDCTHQPWRTYQQATRWWIRCESCEGRLASGKVGTQEDGTTMLLGWRPVTWPKPEPEDKEAAELKNPWTCAMCRVKLAQGTTGVITSVGKVCMICRTGPGKMKKTAASSSQKNTADDPSEKDTADDHESMEDVSDENFEVVPPKPVPQNTSAKSTHAKKAQDTRPKKDTQKESTVKGVVLTEQQIEFLEENLTAKQWRELRIEKQVLSAEQMDLLEETLTAKVWRQLWA